MTRELAASTIKRFKKRLEAEEQRLAVLIDTHVREREDARISETSSERIPDPTTAEGGSMTFEYEKDRSVDRNLQDLVLKTQYALTRLREGKYGICESCGISIPIERLEALPHATECVACASQRL